MKRVFVVVLNYDAYGDHWTSGVRVFATRLAADAFIAKSKEHDKQHEHIGNEYAVHEAEIEGFGMPSTVSQLGEVPK